VKIRLTSLERTYTPDIVIQIDDDKRFANRSLPVDKQIKIDLKLANADQKTKYASGYAMYDKNTKQTKHVSDARVNQIVEQHVLRVHGLEENGITTGSTLIKESKNYEEISEIVMECYAVIMGTMPVDYDSEQDDSSEDEKLSKE